MIELEDFSCRNCLPTKGMRNKMIDVSTLDKYIDCSNCHSKKSVMYISLGEKNSESIKLCLYCAEELQEQLNVTNTILKLSHL